MKTLAATVALVVMCAGAAVVRADDPIAAPPVTDAAPMADDDATLAAPMADDDATLAPPVEAARIMLPPPPAKAKGAAFRVNRPITGAFIVVGAALWAGSDRLFQDTLAPKDCRIFCEPEVNPFDRELGEALLWEDDELPQLLSDGAAYVAIPLVALGGLSYAAIAEHQRANWVDDMLIVAETTVITGLANRVTALTFGRTRPRTRTAEPGSPEALSRQAHESFFSGHTSAAFSVGIAAAEVASLRRYRIAPWLWGSAILFGTMTGYMRLAGADHHPTDVLVGAAVATTLGVVVPRLHVRKAAAQVEPMALADGGGVALRGAW